MRTLRELPQVSQRMTGTAVSVPTGPEAEQEFEELAESLWGALSIAAPSRNSSTKEDAAASFPAHSCRSRERSNSSTGAAIRRFARQHSPLKAGLLRDAIIRARSMPCSSGLGDGFRGKCPNLWARGWTTKVESAVMSAASLPQFRCRQIPYDGEAPELPVPGLLLSRVRDSLPRIK
jgi:hypothetical protein